MYEAFRLIEEFENAKKISGAYLLECLFSEMDRNLLNEGNKNPRRPRIIQKKKLSMKEIMSLQPEEVTIGGKTYPVSAYATYGSKTNSPLAPTTPEYEGVNRYNDFEKVIKSRLDIAVPGFFNVHVDPDYIKNHIEAKMRELGGKEGKKEEIRRKTRVPYFWMTLEKPQEIWVNNDNNDNSDSLSFVFFRQFKAELENGKIINLVMIVVVDENLSVKTYYSETGQDIPRLYERRWGVKIFPKD